MARFGVLSRSCCSIILFLFAGFAVGQTAPSLDDSGTITVDGKAVPYMIRHLPVDSFPGLPQNIRTELDSRGCLVPQSYVAHQPENVVHASFEHAGSMDWAVLCSTGGTVSLMVFFGDSPEKPYVLATAPETEHLQRNTTTGVYGFNWAIDPAGPQRIHDAATGQRARPQMLDHDALADSLIDRRTVFHFYVNNSWTLLDLPEK